VNPKLILHPVLILNLLLAGYATAPCNAAIVYPAASDGGRQIVYKYADEILRSDPRFLGGFRIEQLTMASPFRDYGVGLTDLAAGSLLCSSRIRGATC